MLRYVRLSYGHHITPTTSCRKDHLKARSTSYLMSESIVSCDIYASKCGFERYFLHLRQSWFCLSGAVKFCFAHMLRQQTQDIKSNVSCLQVKVIDLFNETVSFNLRGGRSPPRWSNRQSS